MEALPGCGHTLVYHGAIPVLCSKLVEISYIDLAEQTLIVSKITSNSITAIYDFYLLATDASENFGRVPQRYSP